MMGLLGGPKSGTQISNPLPQQRAIPQASGHLLSSPAWALSSQIFLSMAHPEG